MTTISIETLERIGQAPLAFNIDPGIYADIPEYVYHRRNLGVASKSGLDHLARSPLHYKHWIESTDDEEPSKALAFGSAFHMCILEPERFSSTYALEPSFGDLRRSENKNKREVWRSENINKRSISLDDYEKIDGMRESLRKHPIMASALDRGKTEQSMFWKDEKSGVYCKARVDLWSERERVALDLKTTEDASLSGFRRSMGNYAYHRQADFYTHGFDAVGNPIDGFVFVAVEKSPPYAVGMYLLDRGSLLAAQNQNDRLLETMAKCVRDNSWPGYSQRISTIQMAPWALEDA